MRTSPERLSLPWTIHGPVLIRDDQANEWWKIRVRELPGFLVAGNSRDEAIREYRSALVAFLESYTENGEEPPSLTEPATPSWQILLDPRAPRMATPTPPLNLAGAMLTMGSPLGAKVELAP